MRILIVFILLISGSINGQVLPGVPVAGIPSGTTAQINAIPTPVEGLMAYSTDDNTIYYYNGTAWVTFSDDQNASEVPLVTNVDVNGTASDPTPVLETNVEQVVQAIAPITSKAGRVFYPPSIEIDASAVSTTDEIIELHDVYANQYDLTQTSVVINGNTVNYQTAKSPSAPNNIPIYAPGDLYYYITFADSSVFNIISLSDTGRLTYRIVGTPTNDNTIINVVFVVR